MRKIGIRYYDTDLTKENFIKMRDGGMSAVELCCVKEPDKLDFKKVRELGNEHGIELWSCHLPFQRAWSVVQDTKEARDWAFDFQCMIIERAADVGIDKFVSHPSYVIPETANREECLEQTKDAHFRLAEFAHARGAKIAVENMIPICLGRTADELLDIVNVNDKLRICYDVNHLLLDSHDDLAEKIKDKLITVHISDYDFINERHWFPGEGKIDWVNVYRKLCEIGYEGVWMYELSPGTKNDFRSRELTVRDFYNNAVEIFSGKQPSRI